MNIKSILAYIKFRPAMFVGSFKNLREFILGFNIANQMNHQEEFIDNKCVVLLWRRGSHEVWN